MEHSAAVGAAGVGAGQHIDADAFLEGVVGPDSFDDDALTRLSFRHAGTNDDAALRIAETHAFAVGRSQLCEVGGMKSGSGPSLACDTRRRVAECWC